MGWDYIRTSGSVKDVLLSQVSDKSRIVAMSGVCKGAIYIAFKIKDSEKVAGMVVLVSRSKGEIGFKFMGEDAMPYYFDCPKKILNLLSPVEELYSDCPDSMTRARNWRQSCVTT